MIKIKNIKPTRSTLNKKGSSLMPSCFVKIHFLKTRRVNNNKITLIKDIYNRILLLKRNGANNMLKA